MRVKVAVQGEARPPVSSSCAAMICSFAALGVIAMVGLGAMLVALAESTVVNTSSDVQFSGSTSDPLIFAPRTKEDEPQCQRS